MYPIETEPRINEHWVVFDLLPTYEISNYGRIGNTRTGRELPIEIDSEGYSRATMYYLGKSYRVFVHLLVVRAFFINYKLGAYVGFVNDNKQDCTVLNLTLVPTVRRGD